MKHELHVAQFLYGCWERSQQFAEELDPERKRGKLRNDDVAAVVSSLDRISRDAIDGFMALTGRHPFDVERRGRKIIPNSY